MRELAHTNAELVEDNARLRQAEPELRKLQEAFAAIASREGQLRSALIDAHDQLLRRDEEIRRLREQPATVRALRNRLRGTPAGRAYVKARRVMKRLASLVSGR
jgi:chromosome segregation ATPase